MNNSNDSKEEYNTIPVVYCKNCMSLKIMILGGMDYCDDCGCTDINATDIASWEEMYIKKHGKPLIVK